MNDTPVDSACFLKGSFDRDLGVKGRALTGGGSVSWETGALEIQGRLSRPVMRVIAGCVGVVVGLALVVAAAVVLEDLGLDLMHYRKGPVFVGMLALVAMGVGYGWAGGIADWLVGRRVVWTIPLKEVRARISTERSLGLAWDTEPPNETRFCVAKRDAGRLAKLAEVLGAELAPATGPMAPKERPKPSRAAPGGARFDVVYVRFHETKIPAIKAICDVTGWGLARAKEFVENPPGDLKADLPITEARKLADDLRKSNVEVTLRPR